MTAKQVKATLKGSDRRALEKDGITEYTATNGAIIKVGDKIRLNRPEGGAKCYISITKIPTVMDALGNMNNFNPCVLATYFGGKEITIKKFFLTGDRKVGGTIHAVLLTTALENNLDLNIELAIESNEIRSNGIMTSEEAMTELKSAKDKLDLQIITQAEFDAKKQELINFIK